MCMSCRTTVSEWFRAGHEVLEVVNRILTHSSIIHTEGIQEFVRRINEGDLQSICPLLCSYTSRNARDIWVMDQLLKGILMKYRADPLLRNFIISEILNAFLNPRMCTLLELSFNATSPEVQDIKQEILQNLNNFCSSELTFENWVRQAILAPKFPPERWLPQSVYPQCWRANEGYLNLGYLDFSEEIWIHLETLDVLHQIRFARVYQLWYSWRLGTDRERSFPLINGEVEIKMMLIPPGKFWMGSPEDEKERHSNEDRHQVLIKEPFWCVKYPITQEQYKAVIGTNPSHFQGDTSRPVEKVNWEECQEFCKKTKLRLNLLTEAQWEYACRAGTTTDYSFGDDFEQLADHAWYSENSGNKTRPVGQKQSNAFGLCDMHGNVWEWCKDYYHDSYGGDATDPVNLSASSNRVIRGGSWFHSAVRCRSAFRRWIDPSVRGSYLGLRVCRSLSEKLSD